MINGHNILGQASNAPESAARGLDGWLKRLILVTLIFAVTAFGINQCAILFHKTQTAGLWRNIQTNWNRSLAETNDELRAVFGGKSQEEINQITRATVQAATKEKQRQEWRVVHEQWRKSHPGSPSWDENGQDDTYRPPVSSPHAVRHFIGKNEWASPDDLKNYQPIGLE